MRETFNRMLLLVHGQGDELATMSPPCRRGYGSCDVHGDCECEFQHDVPPDASRTFRPAPLPQDVRAHINRMAVVIAVTAFSALAALLGISDARWVP